MGTMVMVILVMMMQMWARLIMMMNIQKTRCAPIVMMCATTP